MQKCQTSCPKVNRDLGSYREPNPLATPSYIEDSNGGTKSVSRSGIINRRSPSQSQKSVQIGGVTAVEARDSEGTRTSEETISYVERHQSRDSNSSVTNTTSSRNSEKSSPQNKKSNKNSISVSSKNSVKTESSSAAAVSANLSESHRKIEESVKHESRMSPTVKNYSRETIDTEWNSIRHDPCPSNCPMSKARDLARRKAELRQERLDDYLLNKGFSYFDDLCTCSSICLMNQLRRDKFVVDMLKSVCLFVLGMKLCDELDAWNIIG